LTVFYVYCSAAFGKMMRTRGRTRKNRKQQTGQFIARAFSFSPWGIYAPAGRVSAGVDELWVNKRYTELLASDAAAVLPICLTIERAMNFRDGAERNVKSQGKKVCARSAD